MESSKLARTLSIIAVLALVALFFLPYNIEPDEDVSQTANTSDIIVE